MPTEPELPGIPDAPDTVKAIRWLSHHFQANWDTFRKVPVIVALAICFVGGILFGKHQGGESLDVAAQRIAFLSEQVAAYKDRLQGATPDQAAKELYSLRSKLEEAQQKLQILMPDKPRRLTKTQIDKLHEKRADLTRLSNSIMIYSGNVGDSALYASDFAQFFRDEQISYVGPTLTSCSEDQIGILVGLQNPGSPSLSAVEFTKILQESGLKISHTKWNTTNVGGKDFDLFICGGL